MVEVSLLKLVTISGTRDVWPPEFDALVKKCEEDPAERLPFGLVADWCDEHGEPDLGYAFRWLEERGYDVDEITPPEVTEAAAAC